MHDDCKLASDGHRSALEAQPLKQLKPPALETALGPGTGAREKYCRRFIKQPPADGCHPFARYGRYSRPHLTGSAALLRWRKVGNGCGAYRGAGDRNRQALRSGQRLCGSAQAVDR